MTTYACPKGHDSTEADYCSECGARMQAPSIAASEPKPLSAAPSASAGSVPCPDCGTMHAPTAGLFCEVCGYNFVTGAHGEIPGEMPVAAPTPQPTPAPPTPQPPAPPPVPVVAAPPPEPPPAAAITGWELTVMVDASLRGPDSPEAPVGEAPIVIKLEKDSNLIGRTSERRAIHPEVPLDLDEAVSHRHALLNRQTDGLILRDIGSSNGTSLNGAEVKPLSDVPLNDGDQITLGHWTRIAVKAVR